MSEIKFTFDPDPEFKPLTKEEIFGGDKECERIITQLRKFKDDLKFLDPEIQDRYQQLLSEGDGDIKYIYDMEGKDVYLELIEDIEKEIKERKDLLKSFNENVNNIGKKVVAKYFQLSYGNIPKIFQEYHYLVKKGDFDFIIQFNIVTLKNFIDEFNKLNINQEIVADMERKDIAEKQREKKLSQKRQRKEMVKELKYGNLELIKLIASHIGLDDKITNENSLDNLNFEDLKQLTEAHNEIRKIIDEYGADIHNKAGRKDVIEEWLVKKRAKNL